MCCFVKAATSAHVNTERQRENESIRELEKYLIHRVNGCHRSYLHTFSNRYTSICAQQAKNN